MRIRIAGGVERCSSFLVIYGYRIVSYLTFRASPSFNGREWKVRRWGRSSVGIGTVLRRYRRANTKVESFIHREIVR
jgi:hypothetical protein